MKKVVLFLADGFEDVEALGTVDILRRGGVEVTIAGVTSSDVAGMQITSSHNIKVIADIDAKNINVSEYDAIICPGGMPGATNLRDSDIVINAVQSAYNTKKLVAAICAAPMVLEKAGILAGKNFTMYPGMENYAPSGKYNNKELVVKDDNIITGAGPFATFKFALSILAILCSEDVSNNVASGMLVQK